MEAFNEPSMMPTVHGQHRPELLFPPPQQQQQQQPTPPDHPVAITGYPPAHRSHSQPNTPFDTYMGSGPPVAMSSSTPQPPGQVQFQQRRFPQTSQIDNSPSMPPPPPPHPQLPRRPITTVPGGGGPYQQQQFSQPYPLGPQMGPRSSHSQQEQHPDVQQLQQARLQHQRQLRQQQQQQQYQQQQRQQQQQQQQHQQYNYATTNGLPRKRPHSTQTPPMYRPPPAKRGSPAVAPPGTINPSDLQQARGPVPVQMPPGPERPASNPPPPVPQQFQQPPQPPRNTTSASPATSSLTGQPRPQVRSTPPFVPNPQGGVMQQQAPQRGQQTQQQQQHPTEYQRQQAEYHKRLQYQQQQQRQLRPSNNVNGGGAQLQIPQQPQSQPQQQPQLILSFDVDDYAKEELAKHTADLTTQFLTTQTWFPELENQYFPSYMVPTWTDLNEPGPCGPKLPLESYTETDPDSQQRRPKPALVEDWLLDKTGALTIPAFYVPCEFCTWLRIKTGQGGHCFPSFAVRDAAGEDTTPNQGGRRVTLHTDKHVVRPRCTTCVGFGIETCTVGDNLNINDDPQINVEREAEYMRNTAVRDILPKPLQGEEGETAVTGATDVEML